MTVELPDGENEVMIVDEQCVLYYRIGFIPNSLLQMSSLNLQDFDFLLTFKIGDPFSTLKPIYAARTMLNLNLC